MGFIIAIVLIGFAFLCYIFIKKSNSSIKEQWVSGEDDYEIRRAVVKHVGGLSFPSGTMIEMIECCKEFIFICQIKLSQRKPY